jgi:hypothetical protein
MSIEWFKTYHEALDDPKFLGIARRVQSKVGDVFHVFMKLLKRASENEDRGSIAGFDEWGEAAYLGIAVEEVRRIVEVFRDIGMIVGDRIAQWAKRQGAAAKKLAGQPVSAGALRMRRCRANKQTDRRQGELMLPIPGGASPQASPGVTPSVTVTVTSTAEEEGESQRKDSVFLKTKGESCGRDAPLGEAAPPTPAEMLIAALRNPESAGLTTPKKPAEQTPAIKQLKKEQRRAKCFRYIVARFAEEERGKRMSGMMGLDPDHNEQWWFDHVDDERRREGWDDTRDIANDNRWRAAA